MERFTLPSDKDFLRMAMLKQETIFRHQVGELHRVYRVQKAMMRELRREAVARRWGSAWSNNSATYYEQQQEEKECVDAAVEGEDVELTLATGHEARRRMATMKESGGDSEDDDDGFKRRAPWFSDCLTLRIM